MLKLSSHFMPRVCLLHIYNAFLLPYLSYCNIVWGNACKLFLNPLLILQKKAVRLIHNVPQLTHCAPLAKQLNILFFDDLYYFCVLKYMYNVFHEKISFDRNLFRHTGSLHSYCTRSGSLNFYVSPIATSMRRKFVVHSGIMSWNNLNSTVKLLNFSNFMHKVKDMIFSKYV
jgi:hypothetical protein